MALVNVRHQTDHTTNCNSLVGGDNHMISVRTVSDTENTPYGNSLAPQGLLWYIDYFANSVGQSSHNRGMQYWLDMTTGDVWHRVQNQDSSFTAWDKVSGNGDGGIFVKRPENETELRDANDVPYSGIFRTRQEPDTGGGKFKTLNLPAGASGWGVLQHYYENITHDGKTGFQLYAPIDGDGFGNLYIRVFNRKAPLQGVDGWKKLNISKLIELQDKVWSFPTDTATNIDTKDTNSYFVTTDQSNGTFPQGVGKHGILKTTVTPQGYIQQKYTPVEGNFQGYEFTRVSKPLPTPRSVRSADMWSSWATQNSHVKIMNNRDSQVPLPSTYKSKAESGAGFIYHEWKYTSATGMNLPQGEKAQRCILTTYVPTPKEEELRNDHSDMVQFAFIKDGAVYKRNGKSNEDAWDTWKGVPVGQQPSGGGLTMTDITNMFTHWKTT